MERADSSCTIEVEDAKFWFDFGKNLIQIGVTVGFKWMYDNKIGVGNTIIDNTYIGTSKKGLIIEMYVKDGKIISAFPQGVD